MLQNKKHSGSTLSTNIVWLPTILYCGLIFYLSSSPVPESISQFPVSDKVLHFFEYGLLSILFFYSLSRSIPRRGIRAMAVLSILFASLYGASDEIHQYFVPGRDSSVADLLADIFGATVFQSKSLIKKI